MYFRLCLVRVKYFPENKYFPEMLFSRKENIFQYLIAFQNIFWKIFSGVWLYSWKCSKKPNFIMFLTFSCIFSASKQIYHQLQQNTNSSKPKFSIPNKKKFIKSEINSGQRTTKQEPPTPPEEDWPRASRSAIRRDDLGFDEWCVSGSRRSVTNGFDDGRARRSEEWVRRTSSTIWEMGSRSDDLGIARRTSSVLGFLGSSELLDVNRSRLRRCWCDLSSVLSLSLSSIFLGRKWFEVKMRTEIIFRPS